MRRLALLGVSFSVLCGCHCRNGKTAFPPVFDFRLPATGEIAGELRAKEGRLRTGGALPADAVAGICSSAFTTLVAGRHCTPREVACCKGSCKPDEIAAACREQPLPSLDRYCCEQAFPGFLEAMPACQGMRLRDTAVYSTEAGPKPIP